MGAPSTPCARRSCTHPAYGSHCPYVAAALHRDLARKVVSPSSRVVNQATRHWVGCPALSLFPFILLFVVVVGGGGGGVGVVVAVVFLGDNTRDTRERRSCRLFRPQRIHGA